MPSRGRWSFAIACGVFAVGTGIAARADAGDVTLTLRDGRATIVARNASLQQILREWALRGATRFVNLERVANTPISLELKDMPERQALAILLRSVAGYIAAPRAVLNRSASQYDRILILPTSMASTAPAMPPRAVVPTPVIPDPTELANDEPDDTASPSPGGEQGPGPPGPQNPPVYVPPPSDTPTQAPGEDGAQEQQEEPTNPGVLPAPGITPGSTPGQFTSPAPGVLPPPPPVQQPRQ